jgi:hypothetical protein
MRFLFRHLASLLTVRAHLRIEPCLAVWQHGQVIIGNVKRFRLSGLIHAGDDPQPDNGFLFDPLSENLIPHKNLGLKWKKRLQKRWGLGRP